jgi:homoserine dehydrogenase
VSASTIRLGVLGCGHVGSAFIQQVHDQRAAILQRTGLDLDVTRVAVRNLSRERSVDLPPDALTHDAAAVVADPDVDVVVELIGGIEPARTLVLEALKAGKPVVTANKELLANVGADLFEAAEGAGVDLLFEAAVAGGIPLVRPLRESLVGEPVRRVMGIVNGTTNYVLTRMTEAGANYHDATSTGRASPRSRPPRSPSPRGSATSSSSWRSSNGSTPATSAPSWPCACTRP